MVFDFKVERAEGGVVDNRTWFVGYMTDTCSIIQSNT